ncbi:adenosine receptor A2b-like [Terrapene carolina triunguis]|uniref:adenosine receptor A2b-like n=1 Tax=Terrapene triunguis TaxID=2587831 RepID=UPI00115640AD|nr:adenosine receptor A2b-like [Terrapene carolina triunguis]
MPCGSRDGHAASTAVPTECGVAGALTAQQGAWINMASIPPATNAFPNSSFPPIHSPPCPGASNGSSPSLDVPYFLTETATAVLSVAGNLFICTVILRDRKLRAVVTNHFLVSLAAADVLVGAVAIPCAQMADAGLPRGHPTLCLLMLCTLLIFTQASVFGLLAIAVERYISILKPFQYPSLMSPQNSLLVILSSWVLATFIGALPLMGWHKPFPPDGQCTFNAFIEDTYEVYFNFVACMLVPLAAMLVLYGRIFLEAKRQIRKVAEREVDVSRQARRRRVLHKELRLATSLFIVLFCFALCWLPVHVINTLRLVCPGCPVPSPLVLATIVLSHANSAINPVVYVFRMRSFRQAFTAAFSCAWHPLPASAPGKFSASGLTPSNRLEPASRNSPLPGK